MQTLKAVSLVAMLSLTACGGGSSSATAPPAQLEQTSGEGLWLGTAGAISSIGFLVLHDGSIWGIYSQNGNSAVVGGGFQATSSTQTTTQISATNIVNFSLENDDVETCSFGGALTPLTSISGSLSCSAGSGQSGESLSVTYSSDYDKNPSINTIAGTYAGAVTSTAGTESASANISANGSISAVGASTGCIVSGTATLHSSGNVYDIALTEANMSSCADAGRSFSGVAYFDSSTHTLDVITLNSDRSNTLIFVGND